MIRHLIIAAACLSLLISFGCQAGGIAAPKVHCSFEEGKGTEIAGGGKIKGGLKWTEGKSGKALAFDGAGYVLVPHAPCFHSRHTRSPPG